MQNYFLDPLTFQLLVIKSNFLLFQFFGTLQDISKSNDFHKGFCITNSTQKCDFDIFH